MHASMTLNNSSCSQETNTCKDLGGDTPRISIQEIRIGLWYPDRYQQDVYKRQVLYVAYLKLKEKELR